ncbi:MAG: class I SAM-dependent methyltransferase [Proteobacteria bacterium]|nr:class I SAM-dependent methyltransferase [Pseudomonadota bacterium]MDA1356681.1 class I SAM-dependent methyltransferase [Pseudomonadota bacterium]
MSKHNGAQGRGAPSSWITRFAGEIEPRGSVLDLACGGGRHSLFLLRHGLQVTACDIDVSALADIQEEARMEIVAADLENGAWPFSGRQFAAIVVTNYLHRPLFPEILAALTPGGLLLYETFAAGNENFGRPRNPAYLLNRGELLSSVFAGLVILAYEDLIIEEPKPAAVQRICARKPA